MWSTNSTRGFLSAVPSICKKDRKKRRRQCTEYYRSALSQVSFFFAPQIAGPEGPAALGGSNRAHPGGLPKKAYFTGFLEGLFKLDKLQRDHRAGSEMYSESRCLSKLPEAFKLAVTSLQSWHFNTFLNIPFSGQVPAYGWLFKTFALFFFWPDTEVCPWPNNANRQAPESAKCLPILLLEPGESTLFSSLTSNSQLTLVLTENIRKQRHHHCIEVAARFWMVGEDRC